MPAQLNRGMGGMIENLGTTYKLSKPPIVLFTPPRVPFMPCSVLLRTFKGFSTSY